MPRTPTPRRRAAVALRGGALAALSLALAGGARAARTPCNASQHAAQQFAQWDSDGDGLVSKSEAEAYVARTVLGLPSLAPFPQFRYEVRAHHESLDSSTPLGLDAAEFAQAAWVRCGSTCMCGEDDDTDAAHAHAAGATLPLTPKPARAAVGRGGRLNLGGAGARRSLGAAAAAAEAAEGGEGTVDAPPNENGDDVPGATVVPGLWSSIASLQGDGLYAVRQMTLFNSNQLRAMVKAWVESSVIPAVGDPAGLATDALQAVICGGVGACASWQLELIAGAGGLLGSFFSLASAFFSKLILYLVPSFSLVQTFQLRAAFDTADVLSGAAAVLDGGGGSAPADSEFDIVALLHVVPGESAMINRFLSRTAKLPVLPSVAVARFSHDGGFELSFSLPQVAMSPGGLGPGTPLLSLALKDEAAGIVTAYHTLLEFEDGDGDGVYTAGGNDTVGRAFALGEMAWDPITHATSDGSCLTETDLEALETAQLVALCLARELPLCTGPSTTREELIAYLEQNPVGCPMDVERPVMIAVESGTSALPDFPDFRLSLSFVTATTPLQDESSGAMVGPNRAKVNVEIRSFPHTLPPSPSRKLALRVAHAGTGAVVEMGAALDGPTLPDWELPDGLPSPGDVLDAIGNVPGLPEYGGLPVDLPDIDLPDLPDLPDVPDFGFGFGGGDDDDDDAVVQTQRLAMVGSNVIETRPSLGAAAASATWAAAALEAAAGNPELVERAKSLFGGDLVAALLAAGGEGGLPAPPEGAFALSAYSTWQETAFISEANASETSAVYASALGAASARLGWVAGVSAHMLATANASASMQWAVFESGSSYILWDPAVGVGERMEARKARADALAASGGGAPGGGGGAAPEQDGAAAAGGDDESGGANDGGRVPGISGTPPPSAPTLGAWLAANWLLLAILGAIVVAFGLCAWHACRVGRAQRKRDQAAVELELAAVAEEGGAAESESGTPVAGRARPAGARA